MTGERAVDWLDRVVSACENFGMVLAGIAFTSMVLISVVDVVLRYGFNSPLSWSYPVITSYLITLVYFASVSMTQRARNHIGIELVTRRLPPRTRAVVAVLASLAMLTFAMLVAGTGVSLFLSAWDNNEVLPGVISWPRWPSDLMVPIGFSLLALRLVIDTLRAVLAVFGRGPLPSAPAEHAAVE
jgi:TRAP-type C4-dicarboxylate transport system permease small subunit